MMQLLALICSRGETAETTCSVINKVNKSGAPQTFASVDMESLGLLYRQHRLLPNSALYPVHQAYSNLTTWTGVTGLLNSVLIAWFLLYPAIIQRRAKAVHSVSDAFLHYRLLRVDPAGCRFEHVQLVQYTTQSFVVCVWVIGLAFVSKLSRDLISFTLLIWFI